jgi:hypothetical protein
MIFQIPDVVDMMTEVSTFWMQGMLENGVDPDTVNKVKDSVRSLMETSLYEKEIFGGWKVS